MKTRLFLTLFFAAALCFYGCTKTEIVELEIPGTSTEEANPDVPSDWGLADDEYYSVSGEGTWEKPYTVSQALEMLDSGKYDPNKGYYVKGIVSCVDGVLSWFFEGQDTPKYTIDYYMSENGIYTGKTNFFVDIGFDLGGEYFTSKDALSAGDKVIVYGRLAIDVENNNRREMIFGKLCYWNGETAEVEEDEGETFDDGEAVEDDYFKEPGDGTAESPYTISQVVELIDSKSYDSEHEYYVKGIIQSALGSGEQDAGRTYWLTENGIYESASQARLDVSNAYDAYGASYPGTRSPLSVGDKVIVYGKLGKYQSSTYRMTEGVLYSWNGRMFVGSAEDPLTVTQALHLERNDLYDPDKIYYVEGVVYANFGLYDNGCMRYEIYNGTDAVYYYEITIKNGYSFGGTRFNVKEELSYKDEIIVYGRLCKSSDGERGEMEIGDLYYLNGEVAAVVIEEDNEDEDISQYLGDDFREFCLYYFDLTHNGKISIAEAELVTEINSSTVEDFAGIEYFPNLQSFTSSSAKYLYLRYNTELSYINMKGAPFADHLDLSYNTKLTAIGEEAFKNCYLKSISFPEGLTSIGKNAFNTCYFLETVTFSGSGLTSIEERTFYYCQALKSIAIPEGVKSIEKEAFRHCDKLTTVTFSGNNLDTIGGGAFEEASISSIEFPESLVLIGSYAFYGCNISSVTFPESLVWIGEYAFYCYPLETVTFPENNLTIVDNYSFANCTNLTTVENLASIGDYAFKGCTNLTTVSFSKNALASIERYAFMDCTNLTSVSFPENSVSEIKYQAFYKCTNLTTIPSFPESLMSIAEEAFYKTGLTSVSFSSNSLCELGEYAFGECTDLTTITFSENSVATIGNNAFRECTNLTTISAFPVSLMSIGNYAFYKTNLTSISFSGNSLSEIGDYAFYRVPLESAVLPEGLTTIGTYAFYYTSIKTASIPSSVTKWGDYTFGSCTGLESVNLSEGLTSIGEWTFGNCSSLKSVTLPESITTIGYSAFSNCTSLKSVTSRPTTPPVVGSYAFSSISTSTLYVPSGSEDAYADSDWAQWFSKFSKL